MIAYSNICMQKTITIEPRFCGPPDSGNGGYVCGMLAGFLQGTVEVMLRKPPPLSKPLQVIAEGEKARLMDNDILIAEATSAALALDAPASPGFNTASEATKQYKGFNKHVFPTCFVCGPERKEHDGLRIFAGRVSGKDIVAAPWIPDASLANESGVVRDEFHWAALDCPGYFATTDTMRKSVLGKMTAQILVPVRVNEKCVIVGWRIKDEGRKHFTGTAIYAENKTLSAIAHGIWIDIE